jgi:hypothetical protein
LSFRSSEYGYQDIVIETTFKCCQESALSHKYHEGLLKLQEKDYAKACELLEDVLKDPLISEIQVILLKNISHDLCRLLHYSWLFISTG